MLAWSKRTIYGLHRAVKPSGPYNATTGLLETLTYPLSTAAPRFNVGADVRGLQLGEFGAGNFRTFKSFVGNLCRAPK